MTFPANPAQPTSYYLAAPKAALLHRHAKQPKNTPRFLWLRHDSST